MDFNKKIRCTKIVRISWKKLCAHEGFTVVLHSTTIASTVYKLLIVVFMCVIRNFNYIENILNYNYTVFTIITVYLKWVSRFLIFLIVKQILRNSLFFLHNTQSFKSIDLIISIKVALRNNYIIVDVHYKSRKWWLTSSIKIEINAIFILSNEFI